MRKVLLIVVSSLSFNVCFAVNTYKMQIENAEDEFRKGNFTKSVEMYESLINVEKISNPYIYYNLVNVYYRNGNI